MIQGVAVEIDAEAVVVRAERPLRAVSSAIVGGGVTETRAIVNLHVAKGFHCQDGAAVLADFARRRGLAAPFVGLLTGAATGRGPRCRFGGPVSELGWLVARTVKSALDAGVARWTAEHR